MEAERALKRPLRNPDSDTALKESEGTQMLLAGVLGCINRYPRAPPCYSPICNKGGGALG